MVYASVCKTEDTGSSPVGPSIRKYDVKIKDLLTEDEFDAAENPDVWHHEDNVNVARIVDQRLGAVRTSVKLRGALIAWVKETDDPNWKAALDVIVSALRTRPSVGARLQGCRSLTQAAKIAKEFMDVWKQF